jgi:dTDP-4-dehydrorhamnose reductase
MSRVMVVGAGGEIGPLLLRAFSGHEVRGTRRPDVELRDPASVGRAIRDFDPEAVVLAAGLADPDRCEEHPGEAYAVNVDGTRAVAEACRGRHFSFLSTDQVFDGKAGPYREEDRAEPINVYGRTKLEAERIVLSVHPRSLVVRTTLVFHGGPGSRSFFSRLRDASSPVPCWTDHLGTYTYGPGLAEAMVEMVERGLTGLWHVAGPDLLDRHSFALRVARRFGKDPSLYRPVSIREAPPRAPRPLRAGLRSDKAGAVLRTRLPGVDEALDRIAESAPSPFGPGR